jgi:uncharacterized protein YjbI with pentapeptide repeats
LGITLLALVGGLIIYSYADWPGARYFGIADKKFWDYLELLIVPAALAFGVYWLNRTQDIRQQEADALQENRTLEMVAQQAQDAALRAYLDQMSQLMLQEGLTYAEPGSEGVDDNTHALARARTLTVLPTLDANRKRSVLQFLYEAGLIDKEHPIVDLTGADLRGIDLDGVNLSGAVLRDTYLGDATLSGADLSFADLSDAGLRDADLSVADLRGADLSGADLSDAKLHGTSMAGAILAYVDLRKVRGLTQEQIYSAIGNGGTLLPHYLRAPEPWSENIEEQIKSFEERPKSKGRKENGKNEGSS